MKCFKATIDQFRNITETLKTNLSFESYFAIKIGNIYVNEVCECLYLYCFPANTAEEQCLHLVSKSSILKDAMYHGIDPEALICDIVRIANASHKYALENSKLTPGDHSNVFDTEPENGYEYRDPFDTPEPEPYEPQDDSDVPR